MDEFHKTQQMRQQLYDDVWAQPLTLLTAKYKLSDNGIRKRCKSLHIPLPPFGYWAKVKAGKEVPERPELPLYDEVVLAPPTQEEPEDSQSRQVRALRLRDMDELSLEELSSLHGLGLVEPSSKEYFENWLSAMAVPERLGQCDELISRHKEELEYREKRDRAYPFRDQRIEICLRSTDVINRDNIAQLPIAVSKQRIHRAYCYVAAILKALHTLKAQISIPYGEMDCVNIVLLGSDVSFTLTEQKTKRRNLPNATDFRPGYEEVYDGSFEIVWEIAEQSGYYNQYDSKTPIQRLFYSDTQDERLEQKIGIMIQEVYEKCCDSKIKVEIYRKTQRRKYKEEQEKQRQEEAQRELRRQAEKCKAEQDSLVHGILDDTDQWFKFKRLSQYAEELEAYLPTCTDEEAQVLRRYIALVQETVAGFDPVGAVLTKMHQAGKESQD